MMKMMMIEQNKVLPSPLYVSDQCTDQSQLQGLSRKRGILSGFHQVALWSSLNRLRLQGLKEHSDSYSASDYLGPVLGSKCLVMQTLGNYLRLGPSEETSESMFQVATRTFNLLYYFPFMSLVGLTSLVVKPLYYFSSVLKSTLFTPELLSSVFPLDSRPF
jgi:hypothetical protein